MNPLASLGLAAIIAAVGFGAGWKFCSDHDAAKGIKTLTRTITVTKEIGATATQAGVQAQATRDRIILQTKVVHDEVPVLVDPSERLSAGFVRVYNDSLGLPANAGPAVQSGDPAGSVPANFALQSAVVPNNGTCVALAAQVNGLLDFYDQTKALVNAKP